MKERLIAFFYEYRAPLGFAVGVAAYIAVVHHTGIS